MLQVDPGEIYLREITMAQVGPLATSQTLLEAGVGLQNAPQLLKCNDDAAHEPRRRAALAPGHLS